jgi:hypothetical protein
LNSSKGKGMSFILKFVVLCDVEIVVHRVEEVNEERHE